MTALERKLIFSNLLNGVGIQQISEAFHLLEKEINEAYKLVIERIKLCRFKSQMPYIRLDTLDDAKANKLELLKMVDELEPYLDSAPKVKIITQPYQAAQ